MDDLGAHSDRIHYWLAADGTGARVAEYFQTSNPGRLFAGRLFEQVGLDVLADQDPPSYRDTDSPANRVRGEDLIAIEMLSVQIPPEVSFELLYGQLGHELAGLLARVPIDVAMGDPDALHHIECGSPADQAWWLLRRPGTGMGKTRIGKLLAHKRPHLLPVYDDVVRCAVGNPPSWWLALHAYLTDGRFDAAAMIGALRQEGSVPPYVSDLRVIDVAIWRGHEKGHLRSRTARKKCTFPPSPATDQAPS